MTAKLLLAAASASTSMFLFATSATAANQSLPTKPAATFDCGDVSSVQLMELQSRASATDLSNLAKRCDEQAEEYELKAKDALQANNKADVSFLREKAANAYMNVAVFTNSSLFKNDL